MTKCSYCGIECEYIDIANKLTSEVRRRETAEKELKLIKERNTYILDNSKIKEAHNKRIKNES